MIDKKTKRFKPAPALSCESKSGGSALIMTIVLTSLLAIVAVMFVAVARMDRASTSNIADNKTLDLAAKSIAEIISRELINDTPGVRSGEEYYDYPDPCNAWLASIEPYKSGTDYYWRQISDVTGCLKNEGFDTNDVDVNVPGGRKTVDEYPDITLTGGKLDELWADADGDGIADSKWFELKDLYSSKGKAIYAAVRVIDNGGMVNINTAHSFNPDSGDITKINGSTQMQINLRGLLKGTPAQVSTQMTDFNEARCSGSSEAWPDYERNVIWDYNTVPGGGYLPFDISDELELRYRYCIDSKFIGRVESNTPPRVLPVTLRSRGVLNFGHLYRDSVSNWGLADWQERITEPNNLYADRRHMLTTVNYDRVIDPNGDKMTNINDANANSLYASIRKGILDANSNFPDVNEVSAQIAVNIIDYRDGDSNVTVFSVNDVNYYGFETPCAYISELACRVGTDVNDPNRSYAIELFKPYDDIDPNNSWNVVIDTGATTTIPISDWSGTNSRYYVIRWNNTFVPLDDVNGAPGQSTDTTTDYTIIFDANSKISLTRNVNGADIVVDSVEIPPGWSPAPSPVADSNHCIRRDIRTNKCIMRLWDLTDSNKVTL
ncbi:MAG: hypothetical protein KKE31_01530, partial [Planctomycetes bacterium]|nr:hypothetical protein [Planctomycetota bacterium]